MTQAPETALLLDINKWHGICITTAKNEKKVTKGIVKRISEMRTQQTGIGGMQLLLITAALTALIVAVTPAQQAFATAEDLEAEKLKVAAALNFVGESKRKITQSVMEGNSLPRTAAEALKMKPTMIAQPEFVKEVKFQHDYSGEATMIMVYLNDGVVENILGGEQYIYIAGINRGDGADTLKWQCGARNVDLSLLPKDCQS